jgi:putative ABC transport system permease protein
MFLALREVRRALARFALLAASIGLLVFLILFQQTLQDGLIT